MRYFIVSSKTLTKYFCLFAGLWVGLVFNSQAQLSGVVFKDFNNDGIQNPPHELGMRNITVSVFVGSSASPLVAQTDINGLYGFTADQVPAGSMVRVEFTGLGANNNGKSTGQSKTNVQFLTIPAGGATDVSLGILTNNDYCKLDGTLIFTPCYVKGDALAGGSAGADDAFVSFPYNASGVGGTTGPMPTHIATAAEVGSLWGMDYQGRGKTVLTSAIVRRHVGLGPLGTGGIYKFNTSYTAIEPLIDVKTIGIDTGPDPHTDLPADKLANSEDAASVAAAGKVGIGGIALSGDEKNLYMVNLYDRKLYRFFVGVPAKAPSASSVKSFEIPNPCPDSDYRPWGVKEYQGNFYLGVVCTNQTSQDSTTLFGTIYKFDPKTETFSIFYQFPLTYKRGPADATDACINIRYWRPWSDTFPKACASFFDAETGKVVGFALNPQPLIADLEFDTDGTMIIGLMDRFGLIAGFRSFAPVDDGKLYDGFVSGDILRVYNNNGVYEMENNGQAGPLTGSGVGNDEGFGGGEFYGRDYWNFFGQPAHSEITNGGLMLLPGTGEVLASAMDPVDEVFHAGGFQIFSNTDGSLIRSFAVYAGKKGTLGKSGGVGDMKATCGDAFIEIGNRVWKDENKNGVQDPNEEGIDGVTVTLHDMENSGQQIASTTTTNGGTFVFNNENVTDTVKYEHHYQIRIKMLQPSLVSNELIEVSSGGTPILPDEAEAPAEMRDNDANLVRIPSALDKANLRATNAGALTDEDFAVIDFQTGANTLSNHSLDIGISGCTTPTDVLASSNSPVNEGETINLTATSTNGLSYEWVGSNGFSSTLQNPSITAATLSANGIYTVTIFGNGTCTATATVEVVVNCVPPTNVVANSNSPVNEGQTINLTASSTGGNNYQWVGPNGFTSDLQNISIVSATLDATGVYTVTVSGNGTCTATATTSVTVNCVPPTDIILSSNSPINEGQNINFTATSTGGLSYKWAGPNGFTSNLQNPSITAATLAANGIYTVTVAGNGTCTATATVEVVVNCVQPTNVVANSNSPINEGQNINFTATSTGGVSYRWAGPNGFTSTLQNPSISAATLAANGIYTVTVAGNGTCTATATVEVVVNCVQPTNVVANSNSPISEGQNINFTATSTGGISYKWAGPNGFTSTLQNPSISVATLAANGIYTVTVVGNGTCTATATVEVVVNCVQPTNVIANSNSPINEGQTINLTATSTGGVSYKWAGPNGFTSTLQNPSISAATLATKGIYTVTVSGNGTCTATATTNVVFYASMGDFAWYDLNKNGIQDNRFSPFGVNLGKELPAKGIVMELHKADGTLVGKDTTDINGYYHFDKLLPDSYYVKFDPASYPDVDYAVTTKDGGLNDSLDNDIERVVYKSANFSLTSGQHDPTRDIGFFRVSKSSIGDPCTCHDIVYDPDEIYEVLDEIIVESTPGGVWAIIEQTGMQKIDSLDNYDIPIGTLLIPDSNKPGRYTFRFAHDVGVGYSVKVTNGVDTLSIANMCNIPALSTNIPTDTVCAFASPLKLAGKMMLNNVDVTNGTIKFYVVKGFENYGLTGNPVYTEITEFNPRNFAPGDTIDIIAEYTPTITTHCPIKKWYNFVLAIDSTCLSEIGDIVWNDADKNGIQDSAEKGIPNVSVTLLDANGVAVTKDAYGNSLLGKTTDANGFYEFINLPPADYMIQFGKPTTYTTTVKDAATASDVNNSDADPATGISRKVTLLAGQRNPNIDAGFYLTCVPPANVVANINSPIVEGSPINISASSVGGVSYLWSGPNGFSSTSQNPTIPSAASYMAGTYTVTVESSVKNCSSSASVIVIIESACRPNCIPIMSKKIR